MSDHGAITRKANVLVKRSRTKPITEAITEPITPITFFIKPLVKRSRGGRRGGDHDPHCPSKGQGACA